MTVCAPLDTDRMLTALDKVRCYRHASKPSERVRIVYDCTSCLRQGITLEDYCEALATYSTAAEYLTDHCPATTLNVCSDVDLTNPSPLTLTTDCRSDSMPSPTMYNGREQDTTTRPTETTMMTATHYATSANPNGRHVRSGQCSVCKSKGAYTVNLPDVDWSCFRCTRCVANQEPAPTSTMPRQVRPTTPVAAPAPKQIEVEDAPVKVNMHPCAKCKKPVATDDLLCVMCTVRQIQQTPVAPAVQPTTTKQTSKSKVVLPTTFKQCVALGGDGVLALAAQIGCTLPNLTGKGAHVKLASALWAHINSTETHIPVRPVCCVCKRTAVDVEGQMCAACHSRPPVSVKSKPPVSAPPVRQLRGGTGREVLPIPVSVVAPVVSHGWVCVDATRQRWERTIDGVTYSVRPIKTGTRWLAFVYDKVSQKHLIDSTCSDRQVAQLRCEEHAASHCDDQGECYSCGLPCDKTVKFCDVHASEFGQEVVTDGNDDADDDDDTTEDTSATVQAVQPVKVPVAEVNSIANRTMSNGHVSTPVAVTQTVVESVSASAYKAIAGLLTGAALGMRAMGHSEANGELGGCLSDIERIASILSVRSHGATPLERAKYAPVGTSTPVCQQPETKPIKPAVTPVKHPAPVSAAQHTPLSAALRNAQQQNAPVVESDDESDDTSDDVNKDVVNKVEWAIAKGTLGALRDAIKTLCLQDDCDQRSTRSMSLVLSKWVDEASKQRDEDDDTVDDDDQGEEPACGNDDDDDTSERTADDMAADEDDEPITYKSGDRVQIVSNDDKSLVGKSGTVYKMTDGSGIKAKDSKGRVHIVSGTDDGIPGVYVRVDGEKSATFFMVGEVVSSDKPFVPTSKEKGRTRHHDIPWSKVKVRVYQLMKSKGACDATSAIRAVAIARTLEKEGYYASRSSAKAIRFACERAARSVLKAGTAEDTQYTVETLPIDGERGIVYYLTAKGARMNPVSEYEKAKARAAK